MTLTSSELSEALAVAEKMLVLAGKAHQPIDGFDDEFTVADRHRAFVSFAFVNSALLANAVKALAGGGAEQQPVAWRWRWRDEDSNEPWLLSVDDPREESTYRRDNIRQIEPLYCSPPPIPADTGERGKIVAWLRQQADAHIGRRRVATFEMAANIEVGDHLKPTGGA